MWTNCEILAVVAQVLVVEDDVPIAMLVADHLRRAGHEVTVAHDGQEGLDRAQALRPDLVVLDLMLPRLSGHEVCRAIRREAATQPVVLMLTARVGEEDSILGFECGADDYVRKPFSVRELGARIEALLRLARGGRSVTPGMLEFGRLRVDPDGRRALIDGTPLRLTPMEFDLLLHFARHPNVVVTREQLLAEVWGYSHAGYLRTVDSHVTRVRRKLAEAGGDDLIATVHGVGYVLRPESR